MNKVGRQELTNEINELLDRDYTEQLENINTNINSTKESVEDSIDILSEDMNGFVEKAIQCMVSIKTSLDAIKTLRYVEIEFNEKASGTSTGLSLEQLAGLHSFKFEGVVGDETYNGIGFYEPSPSIAFVLKTITGGGGIYVQPYSNKIVTGSGEFLTGKITYYYFE